MKEIRINLLNQETSSVASSASKKVNTGNKISYLIEFE